MALVKNAAQGVRVQLLSGARYRDATIAAIRSSVLRCWCSLFIIDLTTSFGMPLTVDPVIEELERAVRRRVDVRLVIGGSRTSLEIAELADAARAFCRSHEVPCRWLTSKDVRGSHAKIVIADALSIVGSHNWSPGAFGGEQVQDSLLIRSGVLSVQLSGLFMQQWNRAS